MIDGWEIKTLGDISVMMADGPFGSNLKKEHYTENREVRIIQLSNIGEDGWREENTKYTTFKHLETIQRSEVFPNDIVIAKMMPAGRAIICPNHEKKFVLSSDAVKVQLKKGVNLRFAWYSINSPYFRKQVYENVAGSGRVRTSLTKLKLCKLRLPSLPEQQRIVDILDREFAKIDALKANAEKSLQAAKDLFQATLKKELEPKDGWKTIKMGDYFRITSSKRVFQADWTDKGVPFYRAREIVKLAKYGSVNNDLFITPEMYDTYKAKYGVPKVGDVLITGVGTLGVCFLVENENPFYFKDGNVIWLQKEKEISSRYVIYCYQTNDVKEQVHSTQGAVVGTYTIEKANATTIPLPPTIEIQEEIVSRLDVLNDKCNTLQENYQKTLTLCDDLKQSLLHKAFNGEL